MSMIADTFLWSGLIPCAVQVCNFRSKLVISVSVRVYYYVIS